MTTRTQLKAGKLATNHNEALQVRSSIRAGKLGVNHGESLRVRSSVKAGGWSNNHSEKLDSAPVSMRRQPVTVSRKDDRLELLVVRAGLRAGRRARGRDRN